TLGKFFIPEVTPSDADVNVASMSSLQFDASGVPDSYKALALWPEDASLLLICLLVEINRAEGSAPFVLLRESADASVYLGCLADTGGDQKAWIEIWLQNVDRCFSSWGARLEALKNAFWDRRWSERVASIRSLKRQSIIETGFETRHPA